MQAGQFTRLDEYEQGLRAMQSMQTVPNNVGQLQQWMGKAAGLPSEPYQKLFKSLIDKTISPVSFTRIMREVVERNPGIKPPTQPMKDALTKLKIPASSVGDWLRMLREKPNPARDAMQSYVMSGASMVGPGAKPPF